MSKKIQIRRRIRTMREIIAATRHDWPEIFRFNGATPQTWALSPWVYRGKARLAIIPLDALRAFYTRDGVLLRPLLERPVPPGKVRVHFLSVNHGNNNIVDLPYPGADAAEQVRQ
jgi:hypothetical protein